MACRGGGWGGWQRGSVREEFNPADVGDRGVLLVQEGTERGLQFPGCQGSDRVDSD